MSEQNQSRIGEFKFKVTFLLTNTIMAFLLMAGENGSGVSAGAERAWGTGQASGSG
jgi:hypothetical protein